MIDKKKIALLFCMPIIFTMIIPFNSVNAQSTIQSSVDLKAAGYNCEPGITIEIDGRIIKVEGYSKEKTKDGTTIVITKEIDETSPIIEDLLDEGKLITIKIIVCSTVRDESGDLKTTKYTIVMEDATIEKISQEANDDGTPAKEKITIKGKKSKSTFEK